ncbi:MAG: type IV secretory system conjugative DNA transfer family protein [Thermoleophilaceae bacterium]|nr:type IV secretory system conjugative DNA transfer family protein [Thermoleophilaceae bacterium]
MIPQNQPQREINIKLVLFGFIAVMSFGVICFFVGELLNLLASGHFTGARLLAAPALGIRMLAALADPATAWPAEHRPYINETVFWLGVLAVYALIAALAYRHAPTIARVMKGRNAPPESATWAVKGDLSDLVVSKPGGNRVVLGKSGRALIAAEVRQSTCAFGPTQQGKSTAIAVPAICEWEGSALITSVKSDLLEDTIAVRRQKGPVYMYDPAETNEIERRHTWTPLSRCNTFEGAQTTSKSLTQTAKQALGGGNDNGFWYEQAQMLLAPLMYAAKLGDFDMGKVVNWLSIGVDAKDEITRELVDVYDGLDDLPLNTLRGVWAMANEQRDSVYLTARSVVEAYRSPRVLDSARSSEITPDKLIGDKPATAYLCAPITEQKQLAALYGTLINEIIDYGYQEYAKTGRPLDPPLLVVLDEAANIAPLPDLDKLASTAAGVGIQLVTIFQDFGQVRERWGHDKAQTIVSNHRATIVLPGVKCEHTLKWVGDVTGEQSIRQVSFTDGHQSKSTTESDTYRRMLPSNLVREMKTNTGLLIYGNIKPAMLDLRPWYAEPSLKKMIEDAKNSDPERFNPITYEVTTPDHDFKRRAASQPLRVGEMNEDDEREVLRLTSDENPGGAVVAERPEVATGRAAREVIEGQQSLLDPDDGPIFRLPEDGFAGEPGGDEPDVDARMRFEFDEDGE